MMETSHATIVGAAIGQLEGRSANASKCPAAPANHVPATTAARDASGTALVHRRRSSPAPRLMLWPTS